MSHPVATHLQLDDQEYTQFRELILARTGLMFGARRRDALGRAVAEKAKHAGYTDLGNYWGRLQSEPTNSALWDDLIKSLTINETYFFRDPDQIEALRKNILPDLIARHWADRTLRLWSAGCSTGEEPYTLAILLRQLIPDFERWKILILATDINKHALQTATEARYRAWSFRQTDSTVRQTYFTQHGDSFELLPIVRQMVTFAYLNLAEAAYPAAASNTSRLDLILCRNVAIYLPEHVISQVAQRFYECLAPGGWLVVGPSETNDAFYRQFQTLRFAGAIVYQKLAWSPPASPGLGPKWPPLTPASTPPQALVRPKPSNNQPLTPPLAIASSALPASIDLPLSKPLAPVFPPPVDTGELFRQGETLLNQRRYEEARQCFMRCLEHNPNEIAAQSQMARLEANAGRLAEARHWAERILASDPLRYEAHYTLALIHQEQGETAQAIASYKKVLYLDPGFILAYINLSNLLQKAGQTAEAARYRAQAVRLAAKQPADSVLPGTDDLTVKQLLDSFEQKA